MSTAFVGLLDIAPMLQLSAAAATPVYCGLDGSCSTMTNGTDLQMPFSGTGSFTNVSCQARSPTANPNTVILSVGACSSPLRFSSSAQVVMTSSAWTPGTASFTDSQCAALEFTAGTAAAKSTYRCRVKEPAGS